MYWVGKWSRPDLCDKREFAPNVSIGRPNEERKWTAPDLVYPGNQSFMGIWYKFTGVKSRRCRRSRSSLMMMASDDDVRPTMTMMLNR
jgi:hypothetical protein